MKTRADINREAATALSRVATQAGVPVRVIVRPIGELIMAKDSDEFVYRVKQVAQAIADGIKD